MYNSTYSPEAAQTVNLKKNQRNSSIELLRIISMFMIVLNHFGSKGEFTFTPQTLSVPRFWWGLIVMGGQFGVDIFVLISGYFLINDKNDIFNFKRILKFWGQVFFYSIAVYCIFGIAGASDFSIVSAVKVLFPITFESWWFASTYFVLYLLHPFINMLLRQLDQATFQKLLVMLVIIWCIIPTFTTSNYQGNYLLWFIVLYSIAGYVRLYGLNPKWTIKHWIRIWLLFSVLRYLSYLFLVVLGTKISSVSGHTTYFYGQHSVLTLLTALSFFMIFEQLKMGCHKWINIIASAAFGVYLIHCNEPMNSFLWVDVFQNAQYQESMMIIPYSIITSIIVYIVCTIIDLLRQQFLERPCMKIVDRYADSWLRPFEKVCEYCKQIVFGK